MQKKKKKMGITKYGNFTFFSSPELSIHVFFLSSWVAPFSIFLLIWKIYGCSILSRYYIMMLAQTKDLMEETTSPQLLKMAHDVVLKVQK